jgi:hypothetical protein
VKKTYLSRKKATRQSFFAGNIRLAFKAESASLEAVVANSTAAGKYSGPRANEYSQSEKYPPKVCPIKSLAIMVRKGN